MLTVIKGNQPISVKTVRVLIYGQPSLGKTSIAYTADAPLVLDFDQGAHRSKQRTQGDTVRIDSWEDMVSFLKTPNVLDGYKTIVIDTVGRALDYISAQIIKDEPKMGTRGGALTMQGYGALKGVFTQWIRQLTLGGRDIIMIAHDKEDKDGDRKYVRPDIVGGSLGEVVKTADFMGYVSMQNNQRIIDFVPCDAFVAKDSGIGRLVLPDFAVSPKWFGSKIEEMKHLLSGLDMSHEEAVSQLQEWRDTLQGFTVPEDFTAIHGEVIAAPEPLKTQIGSIVKARMKELGIVYDKKDGYHFKAEEVTA